MAVRNFWIDADIDGRQTMLSGGPKGREGGMDITIYQREDGGITTALRIKCWAEGNDLFTKVDFGERGESVAFRNGVKTIR